MITQVNINKFSPVPYKRQPQEKNSVFQEQSNEPCLTETPCTSKLQCSADPGNWPPVVDDNFRIAAVKLGPLDVSSQNLCFPADKEAKRCFRLHQCFCRLPNNAKMKRNCLTYSPKQGAVFCFCFNLFKSHRDSLTSCGFRDWQGLSKVLKSHEVCRNDVTNICSLKELANRIRSLCLIDEANQDAIESKVKS